MIEKEEIKKILKNSPSVELLKSRQRELILEFFIGIFKNNENLISSEYLHITLSDFLESKNIQNDEENGIEIFDTFEEKAKKYIKKWTAQGFLRNYNDNETIIYELTQHSHKTIEWLVSLKKKQFVGTESRLKDIFNQLNELIEFTNEDKEKRIEILKRRQLEIEHQIQQLEAGKDVKVFENYQIIEKFDYLNQSAKELFTDFKEVEENFKNITKEIYQKHADSSLSKSDILQFTFDALDELKDSNQGKSFYAFWRFLMDTPLQSKWEDLVLDLFNTLAEKGITSNDTFLKKMKSHLYHSGKKVYKANDKMAQKLSRIIKDNQVSQKEESDKLVLDIKSLLNDISKTEKAPSISLEIDEKVIINIPFEKRLSTENNREVKYKSKPKMSNIEITSSSQINKLFDKNYIDKKELVNKINNILKTQSQTTLFEVIEKSGGIEKGLPELFGYFGAIKKFTYNFNPDKSQEIVFDKYSKKSIRIPEIILLK